MGSDPHGRLTMLPDNTAGQVQRIFVVDSHTAGEPTRVVIGGGPDLGHGTMAERLARLRHSFDGFRTAVVTEPRGSDVQVGALLCEPSDSTAIAGVIFFNNVGYLGMCGHGTIGVLETLRHLGRVEPGRHTLETPVGSVVAELHHDGRVSFENVPAYRHCADLTLEVPGYGLVHGDVAWGGNWFFLTHADLGRTPVDAEHLAILTDYAWTIREALSHAGITGADGAEIDHIELFAPSTTADSRNFVLCPGRVYDRSPCGTGTSAKLACLAAEGRLEPGRVWRQESVIGSVFEARYNPGEGGRVHPTITGRAFITAEATLLLHPEDPYRYGMEATRLDGRSGRGPSLTTRAEPNARRGPQTTKRGAR